MFVWIYKVNTKISNNQNDYELKLINFLSDPNHITIHKGFPANEKVNLFKKNLYWYVSDQNEWPVSEFKISKLLGRLRNLEARLILKKSDMAADGESLTDYGLEEPRLKLDINSSFGTISLLFGNKTRNNQEVYMLPMWGNQKEGNIWAVNKSFDDAANISTIDWLEKDFLKIPIYEINSFAITTKTNETLLKTKFECLEENNWHITTPIRATANSNAIRLFLNSVISTKVDRFITDEIEFKMFNSSLENPNIKLIIDSDNTRYELIISKFYNSINNSTSYPAKLVGKDRIFSLSENFYDFIFNTKNKLREKKILDIKPEDISTFEMITKKNKLSIHKLENKRWEVLFIDEIEQITTRPGDEELINNFFLKFCNFNILDFVNDTPSNRDLTSYGLDSPEKVIMITSKSGYSSKIKLGKISTKFNGVYSQTNKIDTVFTSPKSLAAIFDCSPKSFRLRTIERLHKSSIIESLEIINNDQNSSSVSIDSNSTKILQKAIRNFTAKEIIQEKFTDNGFYINGQHYHWQYLLVVNVLHPGRPDEESSKIMYYFSNVKPHHDIIVGSANSNIIFTISEDIVSLLLNLLDPSPK